VPDVVAIGAVRTGPLNRVVAIAGKGAHVHVVWVLHAHVVWVLHAFLAAADTEPIVSV
jgi:hypothetical protein